MQGGYDHPQPGAALLQRLGTGAPGPKVGMLGHREDDGQAPNHLSILWAKHPDYINQQRGFEVYEL